MIRQAINCDMCGVEKLESTSYWFVADEQGGEMRLRGWESSRKARKNLKHLCGQKCVQRLMANFTASTMAGLHAEKSAKEFVPEIAEPAAAAVHDRSVVASLDRDEMPILERMGYDRETVALIEAESWAGPAKPKDESWGTEKVENRAKGEKGFIHAPRVTPQPVRPFQRMA
jgi:hypothetical protein